MTATATRPTQKDRILALLRSRATVTNADLNQIAFRYSARIEELRAEGHRIEWTTQRDAYGRPTGLNIYRLEES